MRLLPVFGVATSDHSLVVVVATGMAMAGASRATLLIRVRAGFAPAKLNVARRNADEQIVSATSARELKKPDLPKTEKFSMTPRPLIRFSLAKWTYGITVLPKRCSVEHR